MSEDKSGYVSHVLKNAQKIASSRRGAWNMLTFPSDLLTDALSFLLDDVTLLHKGVDGDTGGKVRFILMNRMNIHAVISLEESGSLEGMWKVYQPTHETSMYYLTIEDALTGAAKSIVL